MSDGTLNIANDASATLTGDDNSIAGGNNDLLSIDQGDNNTVTMGNDSGVALLHGDGNTVTMGQNALVGVTDGDNQTLNLGNNANVWLTDTTGSTINASGAFVYAYDNVNVTVNGSNNNISALDGNTITVGGNGQWGTTNSVFMTGGTLNLQNNSNAAITGSYNSIHAGHTDLVTVNGNHNTLQFGSNGLAWVQSGYGNVLNASGGGFLIGDNVTNLSFIGNSNTIYTGTDDNLNVSGTGSMIYGSGSTIYLNGDAVNTYIEGNDGIIHVRAGSVYQLVGNNNTVIVDTVTNVQDGDTIATYNGLSDLLDLTGVAFDSSMTVTPVFNSTNTSGDVVLSSHGTVVATIHLTSITNFESFSVRSNGNGGTLIVDPPSDEDAQLIQQMSQNSSADDSFQFRVDNFLETTKILEGTASATVGITEDGHFDFSAFAQKAVQGVLPILHEFHNAIASFTDTLSDGEGSNSDDAGYSGMVEPLRPTEMPQLQQLAALHHPDYIL